MVRDLVAALAAQGKAILYSSHVLDVVERVCDRVLIIDEGRLVADGSLDALKTSAERGSLEAVFRQLTDTEGAMRGRHSSAWAATTPCAPSRSSGSELERQAASVELPAAWLAAGEAIPGGFPAMSGAAASVVATLAVVFGLRALSRDHLIRASSLMHSGARIRRSRRRRLPIARWVGKVAGGQAARAGYEYLRSLLVRDWQFRRSMAMHAPGVSGCREGARGVSYSASGSA